MQNTGFWWIIAAMACYGLLHSYMASIQFKDWLKAQVGHWMGLYRLVFNGVGG